jgi:hypothetical protein
VRVCVCVCVTVCACAKQSEPRSGCTLSWDRRGLSILTQPPPPTHTTPAAPPVKAPQAPRTPVCRRRAEGPGTPGHTYRPNRSLSALASSMAWRLARMTSWFRGCPKESDVDGPHTCTTAAQFFTTTSHTPTHSLPLFPGVSTSCAPAGSRQPSGSHHS